MSKASPFEFESVKTNAVTEDIFQAVRESREVCSPEILAPLKILELSGQETKDGKVLPVAEAFEHLRNLRKRGEPD
ncbi:MULTISPECIES: hypothetical protein [unclassified Microbulbifer]|uniref:hypothetical protein n=1 Tax=unclassified Microbulbifer TaxID=2619833 RepID=UPI0027E3BC9B|nr:MULTISPECIES: hypothetical protein [unclassified Microbulbifer]